jgi:hypothetical protein
MRTNRRNARERKGDLKLSVRRAMFAKPRARADGRLGRKTERRAASAQPKRDGFNEVESSRAAVETQQPEHT